MAEVLEPMSQELDLEGDLKGRLRTEVACVLEGADLSSTTLGQVRATLENKMGLEIGTLMGHREYIRELLQEKIQEMQEHAADEVQDETELQTSPKKDKNKDKKRRRRIMEATVHLAKKYRRVERLIANGDVVISSADDMQPLEMKIGDATVIVPFKKFNDGRQGFHCVQPVVVQREGRKMQMQCLISCAVLDSEEFPETVEEVLQRAEQEFPETVEEVPQTAKQEFTETIAEVPQTMEQEFSEAVAEAPQTVEQESFCKGDFRMLPPHGFKAMYNEF